MFGRYKNLQRILELDSQADNEEIIYRISAWEDGWLAIKSLEFALFRTYAVPNISRLLNATRQFDGHGQKRYDDTALTIALLIENGYSSELGQQAIAHMNHWHGKYRIKNEDFLYVLSTFLCEPVRWGEKYGWRNPTDHERTAGYHFWKSIGEQMGIQDIPPNYNAFDAFNREYERANFTYVETNQAVGGATIEVFASWYPKILRPMVRCAIYAMLDNNLREAFGFPKALPGLGWLVNSALKLRGLLLRFVPPRRTPYHFSEVKNRTYPQGFSVNDFGPHEAVDVGDLAAQ